MPPHGLGLVPEPSQEPFGNEVFFTTSIDQAAINTTIANDKLSGFVGESNGSLPPFGASSPQFSAATIVSASSLSRGALAGPPFPGASVSKSHTNGPAAEMPDFSPSAVFKTPSLPASAFQSPAMRPSPPASQYYDQRRRSSLSRDLPVPRQNSLLSQQVYPPKLPPVAKSPTMGLSPEPVASPVLALSNRSYPAPLQSSFCSFASPPPSYFPNYKRHSETIGDVARLTVPLADPNMINPHAFPSPVPYTHYPELPQPSPQFLEHPPSPAPSNASQHGRVKTSPSQSPFLRSNQYHPYAMPPNRRLSTSSMHSARSSQRSTSFELDEEARERGLCPIPDCGRVVKDLKAHMLTHQEERPEKCPIQTCEYHTKGFARKYDKNRHTLTHYKGTMVCGFCPGSGSAAEKSFNRADVFKRHLTSVHGVEQAPPNSRKKSPSNKKGFSAGQNTAAGTCSTCNVTFANAQDFYEHLDDCVLRVVQQIDPSEEINEKHLTAISETREVQDTLERNGLHNTTDYTAPPYDENDDEDDEDEEVDNDDANDTTYGSRTSRSGKGVIKSKSKGSS